MGIFAIFMSRAGGSMEEVSLLYDVSFPLKCFVSFSK